MQKGLGRAVLELRARMGWGQQDLAQNISRHGGVCGVMTAPGQGAISRWENGTQAPSPIYRAAMARLAAKHGHNDLVDTFRAPMSAWRLVAHVGKLAGDDK
jgi:transcriptional regulator with XRE-family HTH domain